MIKIDEIYHNVFWTWIQQHRPCMRVFYFWPFGKTDCDSICNYGNNNDIFYNSQEIINNSFRIDNNYTLFFDQEPIDLARHRAVFDSIKNEKNPDINLVWLAHQYNERGVNCEIGELPQTGIIVTSELASETVEQICKEYNWRSAYYFFHGWAALDWFRGHNYTSQISKPQDRTIRKTFIAPNRIIAGDRRHRLIMLYHIFKQEMTDNWISCPAVCPAENISVEQAVEPLRERYPDIQEVFKQQTFPMCFSDESDAPMHSYCLSLFNECSESLLYLVTETVATGRRLHLTEKTFKPICLRMPFIIVGTQGSLAYLRSYGFKTFGNLWDESYDDEPDDHLRLEKIAETLKMLDELPTGCKQKLFAQAEEIIEHNYRHFYSGAFENILAEELKGMLDGLSAS